MTQVSKPVGRPTFRIDGARLRALRKDAKLTQLALSRQVYALANKAHVSDASMKTATQRWEKEGTVQRSMAQYLATVLRTTVAVLQGALPEPAPLRIDEIEQQIKQQITTGASPKLLAALNYYKDDDEPERELASHLAQRLEAAQLSQVEEEFEDLKVLTGWTLMELRKPSSHLGFWLLLRTGRLGTISNEVVSGVADVLYAVRTELQECLGEIHESDAHVSFIKETHWFRVTISHARIPQMNRTLRFVRCQPDECGLRWAAPTWQDEFWLDELPSEAYTLANFVTGFDHVRVPSDCAHLRLAIAKLPGAREYEALGEEAQTEIIVVTQGSLDDLPAERIQAFHREGSAHDLIVQSLASNLWEDLAPFLSEWPLKHWSLSVAASRIDVFLDLPPRLCASSKVAPVQGRRLSVILVEVSAKGANKHAPWRAKSVARIFERLQQSLKDAREMQQALPSPNVPD